MFLLCRCLLEDAGQRDYCGLKGCVADICVAYAYAIGNMDVKSVDAFFIYYSIFASVPLPFVHPSVSSLLVCC